MTVEETLPFADWLRLRESADAAARAEDLLEAVRARRTGDASGSAASAMIVGRAISPETANAAMRANVTATARS